MESNIEILLKSVYQVVGIKNQYYRVLYINRLIDKIYIIELENKPRKIGKHKELSYEWFLNEVTEKRLVRLDYDIFINRVAEDKISNCSKKLRDQAWAQIKDLSKMQPDIYISSLRAKSGVIDHLNPEQIDHQ